MRSVALSSEGDSLRQPGRREEADPVGKAMERETLRAARRYLDDSGVPHECRKLQRCRAIFQCGGHGSTAVEKCLPSGHTSKERRRGDTHFHDVRSIDICRQEQRRVAICICGVDIGIVVEQYLSRAKQERQRGQSMAHLNGLQVSLNRCQHQGRPLIA